MKMNSRIYVCYMQGYGSCPFLWFFDWILKLFCSFPIGFLNCYDIVVYFIFAMYIITESKIAHQVINIWPFLIKT